MNEQDIYANVQTHYTMRLGEGAYESVAWRLACEECEDELNVACAKERDE